MCFHFFILHALSQGGHPSPEPAVFLIPSGGSPRGIWAALEFMAFPGIRFPHFFRRFPACKPPALVLSCRALPAFLYALPNSLLFSHYPSVAMPGESLRGYPCFPCAEETAFTPSLTSPQLERAGRPIRLCLTRSSAAWVHKGEMSPRRKTWKLCIPPSSNQDSSPGQLQRHVMPLD